MRIGRMILGLGFVAVLVGVAMYVSSCPCERLPGVWLSGEETAVPVHDWSFVNDAGLCQIQVNGWRPHAVNLNCMSAENALFISCSQCADKWWSATALTHPRGLIRVDGRLYPVNFERVLVPDELELAWQARARKLGREGSRPDHWWSFRLTSTTHEVTPSVE